MVSRKSSALIEELLIEDLDGHILADRDDKLPRAVYFIIPNELAERFSFYGIRPLLRNFFKTSLGFSGTQAQEMYHGFNVFCYFFPLIGAAISDSYLDKFSTITALSIVYAIGAIVLSVTSVPGVLGYPSSIPSWGPLLGLFLIALGTGGIKPCVSAHGGDQFLSTQKQGLNKFYNLFYSIFHIYQSSYYISGHQCRRGCIWNLESHHSINEFLRSSW